jgi:hypothetical protein
MNGAYFYRALDALAARAMPPIIVALALAPPATAPTGLCKAGYFALRFGRSFQRIRDANLVFGIGWRPAWIVLTIVVSADAARRR